MGFYRSNDRSNSVKGRHSSIDEDCSTQCCAFRMTYKLAFTLHHMLRPRHQIGMHIVCSVRTRLSKMHSMKLALILLQLGRTMLMPVQSSTPAPGLSRLTLHGNTYLVTSSSSTSLLLQCFCCIVCSFICQFNYMLSFFVRIYDHLMNVLAVIYSRATPTIWNSLPHDIRVADCSRRFRQSLHTRLYSVAFH